MSLKPEYFCSGCSQRQPVAHSSLKTCTQCTLVQYCNRECQRNDWKAQHKKVCAKLKKALEQKEIHVIWEFAEVNQSYHAYEKIVASFPDYEDYIWFAYLNLGDMDKAAEGLRSWDAKSGGAIYYYIEELAFNCLTIRKLKNETKSAFDAFCDGLLANPKDSSHFKLAKCDVVMDLIEKHLKTFATERIMVVEERCFREISYLQEGLCRGGGLNASMGWDTGEFVPTCDGIEHSIPTQISTPWHEHYLANHKRADVDLSKLISASRLNTPRPPLQPLDMDCCEDFLLLNDLLAIGLGFFSRSTEAADVYELYLHANGRPRCLSCNPDLPKKKVPKDAKMVHPLKDPKLSPNLSKKLMKIHEM